MGRTDRANRRNSLGVMPGLVPGIHVLLPINKEDVDGRDKPGHDGGTFHRLVISISRGRHAKTTR